MKAPTGFVRPSCSSGRLLVRFSLPSKVPSTLTQAPASSAYAAVSMPKQLTDLIPGTVIFTTLSTPSDTVVESVVQAFAIPIRANDIAVRPPLAPAVARLSGR